MESDHGDDGPRVSVIMPCRNGLPFLAEALEGLRAQTYGNWELLFVDGASTDGSVAAVLQAIPNARILPAPDMPSPGAARNRAARVAEGRVLAFLDADDRWQPRKLERQVAFLRSSGADLVFSDCRVVDGQGDVLGLYLSRHRPARGRVLGALTAGNFVPLSTILVTRDLFEESEGFSESLHVADDYRWLLQVSRHARFDFLPEALADYRLTPGSVTEDFRRTYEENVAVFQELAASEDDPATRKRFEVALSMVLWRWAGREALEGPGRWAASARLADRAMRFPLASPGDPAGDPSLRPVPGLTALARVIREGARGPGLRYRMLRARRPGR